MNRPNGWIRTRFGHYVYPLSITPDQIHIEDIAHSLSYQCRFGGHVPYHYSVAQHSLAVVKCVTADVKLWALLHDAAEAYIGDMSRPIKGHFSDFQKAEAKILEAVALRFSLPGKTYPQMVKLADNCVTNTEYKFFFKDPDWKEPTLAGIELFFEQRDPESVQYEFLDMYNSLRIK